MPSSWQITKVDGQDMDVYHSVPEVDQPVPAVVVIHHDGGVDQFIQDLTDKLGANGYAAPAPNLFHRITQEMLTGDSGRIQHLRDPEVVADINATIDRLRSQTSVDNQSIGVVGFCVGGRATWLAAATNPHIMAAVAYYGGDIKLPSGDAPQAPFDLSAGINCPLLFHFGENDLNPFPDGHARTGHGVNPSVQTTPILYLSGDRSRFHGSHGGPIPEGCVPGLLV